MFTRTKIICTIGPATCELSKMQKMYAAGMNVVRINMSHASHDEALNVINNVGLMEDRATCRISSQHISNWIHHGICSEEEVIDIFKEMALVVDEQNKDDSDYQKMGSNFSGFAFQASLDLAIKGASQPSGYTEPLLHKWRLEFKKNTP